VVEGSASTETILAHPQTPARPDHSRVNVNVNYPKQPSRKKPVLVVVAVLIIALISGVAFLVGRSRGTAAGTTNANVAPSPSPAVVEPSPLPSPSPPVRQEENHNVQRRKPDDNKKESKGSRVGRAFGKGKRFFKRIL
jgi:hypothetical protein